MDDCHVMHKGLFTSLKPLYQSYNRLYYRTGMVFKILTLPRQDQLASPDFLLPFVHIPLSITLDLIILPGPIVN